MSSKFVKGRTAAGAKMINGRLIVHVLGEGATAEVSLCEDPQTGEYYALKKMSKRTLQKQKEYGQGPLGRPKITTGLDKVRKEIEIMKVLWHPNILVLHEVIDDPDEDPLILVLEYAAKGQIMEFDSKRMRYRRNLFDATAQRGGAAGPASPAASPPSASGTVAAAASSSSQAKASPTAAHDQPIAESILRKILSDVLNGLEYLHSLSIVHRDIKPENLLVGSDTHVKLIDFGVARRFESGESEWISETHGTYHFFSPEMCTGDKYCAYQQDIWATGVTMYILATGGLVPFITDSPNPQELFNLISAHRTGALHFTPEVDVSTELKDLLNGILDADPTTRLTIRAIRAHPFMQQPSSPLFHDVEHLHIASPILIPTLASSPKE